MAKPLLEINRVCFSTRHGGFIPTFVISRQRFFMKAGSYLGKRTKAKEFMLRRRWVEQVCVLLLPNIPETRMSRPKRWRKLTRWCEVSSIAIQPGRIGTV